jgi:hypothetical protein
MYFPEHLFKLLPQTLLGGDLGIGQHDTPLSLRRTLITGKGSVVGTTGIGYTRSPGWRAHGQAPSHKHGHCFGAFKQWCILSVLWRRQFHSKLKVCTCRYS